MTLFLILTLKDFSKNQTSKSIYDPMECSEQKKEKVTSFLLHKNQEHRVSLDTMDKRIDHPI